MKFGTGNRALIPVIVSLESAILFEEKCVISIATSDHNAGLFVTKNCFCRNNESIDCLFSGGKLFLDAAISSLNESLSIRWLVGLLVRWSVSCFCKQCQSVAFVNNDKAVGKGSFSDASIASV